MSADSLDDRAEARAAKILRELREHDPAVFAKLGPRDVLDVAVHADALLAERLGRAEQRAADLERRLRGLELRFESEQRGLGYKGIWTQGDSYPQGCFVTHQGGLWHCWQDTDERPGTSDDWQLCVKAGRR